MFGELLEQLGTEAQRRGRAEGSLLRGLEGSGFWGGLAGDAAGPQERKERNAASQEWQWLLPSAVLGLAAPTREPDSKGFFGSTSPS